MSLALRPYVTAGVALVGASVIAVTPLAPPAPDVHLPTLPTQAAVELSAFTNQLDTWASALAAVAGNTQVVDNSGAVQNFDQLAARPVPYRGADSDWATIFNTTAANAAWLAGQAAESWGGLGQQLASNWAGYGEILSTGLQGVATGLSSYLTTTLPQAFQTAFDQLASGQIYWGVRTLVNVLNPLGISFLYQVAFSLLPALQIPIVMAQNFADVLPRAIGITTTLATMIGSVPMVALEVPLADTQRFVDALGAGDGMGALNILANAPARFTDALLNGYVTDPEFPEFRDGGLLGSLSVLSILANNLPRSLMPVITPKTALSSESALISARTEEAAPKVPETEAPQADTSPVTSAVSSDAAGATESPVATASTAAEQSTVPEAVTPEPAKQTAAPLVRESLAVTPGRTGALGATSKPAAKVASDVRDGISATVNKIGESVKKAFAKPEKKSPTASTGSDKSSGSGSSGDAK